VAFSSHLFGYSSQPGLAPPAGQFYLPHLKDLEERFRQSNFLSFGGGAMISFTVNGKDQKVDVAPDTPLLWVLRDTIGLTGTKYGCGIALCGACIVHLNGEPARSCTTPISQVAGMRVTTIEGLSRSSSHPLQKAWIAEEVPQCGYCQSGQIMSAASLLAKNKNPSDADIDKAMSGNICRCGTYNRIHKAILTASAMMRKGA
jgi:isoquinoline 1-oxidoreductase alpha subunit